MRTPVVVLALALVASCALPPSHAVAAALDKGTVEVEGSVSFDHASFSHSGEKAGTETHFDGTVGAAYSLTRMFQVGGGLLLSTSSFSDVVGSSFSNHAIGGSVDVTANFKTVSGLVPFVRVGAGALGFGGDAYTDAKTSILAPMVRAGVRVLVADAGSINLSVAYRHETNADGVNGDDANRFGLAVGISLFPIRGK